MLRYIIGEMCKADAMRRTVGSSASFYYILNDCGSAVRGR
jgi:hypothetical protein